jgi:anti-sigma regulatory factor (Ser/Thr protein kinase)
LAVDEAFTNICHHAYPAMEKGDVVLIVEVNDHDLQITLLDWGEPFNRSAIPQYDKNTPIEQRAHGGMGIHMIEHLMDSAMWIRSDGANSPNMLIMTKR